MFISEGVLLYGKSGIFMTSYDLLFLASSSFGGSKAFGFGSSTLILLAISASLVAFFVGGGGVLLGMLIFLLLLCLFWCYENA